MGYDHAELKEIKGNEPIPSSSSGSGDSSRDEIKAEKRRVWEEDQRRDTVQTALDDDRDEAEESGKLAPLKRTHTHTLGKLKFRADDDDDPTDWWFASTAIPLIAATFAPMANVLSIAALVVSWRNDVLPEYANQPSLVQSTSQGYPDPHWCIALNIASLVCGFVGNLFLLFNFTKRVRYIVALPTTIVLFYFASGILIGLTVSMHIYVPPGKNQVYSQGFWHAIIAGCLYLFNSMILMANMSGYFLGHYPQHFTLTDEQRNLILQTMMFFLWLGGGAGVFARIEGWTYPDALYFCDVTLLTIGFGDYYPGEDLGRGLVFPFSVGGTIILGLMVSSIHKFAGELSKDKVVRKHIETNRINTLSRAVTLEQDEEKRREQLEKKTDWRPGRRPTISSPLQSPAPDRNINDRTVAFGEPPEKGRTDMGTAEDEDDPSPNQFLNSKFHKSGIHRTLELIMSPVHHLKRVATKSHKVTIMRQEKDRFDAMRNIQRNAVSFKKWYALTLSVIAFGTLWCIGAVVFWQAEKNTQDLTYFRSLYFCYVSLLTIGYGDESPKSNAGKPFFVVWSLIAVPTMTILISDMGDTVISAFKRGTFKLADFTVLPKDGLYRDFMNANPWLYHWLQRREMKKRIKRGLPVGPQPEEDDPFKVLTVEQLANERLSEHQLTRKLAFAIRKTADDLRHSQAKKYSYEEWVEFTRLIRFTKMDLKTLELDEEHEGVVEWDWLDENSPMLSEQTEAEWVLDRLCESLLRLLKKNRWGEEQDTSGSTTLPGGFVPFSFDGAHHARDDDIALDPSAREGTEPAPANRPELQPSKTQQRRQRAKGADAMLTFFTGERRGTQAYAKSSPMWSKKALERMDERRRSSVSGKVRQGPFAKLNHGGKTGAVGGGRGGAGTRTLKARAMYGSVDRHDL